LNGNGFDDIDYPHGGALYVVSSYIELVRCHFLNNVADTGGGMILIESTLDMWSNSTEKQYTQPILVQNNTATDDGGFIYANASILTIHQASFRNNSAYDGGVFYLEYSDLKLIGNNSNLNQLPLVSENNTVTGSGGVIYASDGATVVLSEGSFLLRNNMALEVGEND
jgi:predicted outer membrane repeat protein